MKHDEAKEHSVSSPAATATTDEGFGERWCAVERISNSKSFEKSPRIRELLIFVARHSLSGQVTSLSEYEIGRNIFGRVNGYSPTEDSIVRSSIRQLRRKLAEYYENEGQKELWRIEIPKGSYIVRFNMMEPAAVGTPSTDAISAAIPEAQSGSPIKDNRASRRFVLIPLVTVLVASLGLNAWFLFHGDQPFSSRRQDGNFIASVVMNSQAPTQVITDDYAFVLLSRMTKKPITLEQYAQRAYLGPELLQSRDPLVLDLWSLLGSRYLVSLGSMGTVERVLRSVPDQGKVVVRHARNLSARDFATGNFILFGSSPNNPWSQLLEERLNFKFMRSGSRAEFVNTAPQPGEEQRYGTPESSINSGPGYARIAYLPTSSGNGFVLLLTGLNMVTAEAAAEFVTNPRYTSELLTKLNVSRLSEAPHFEALLRTSAFDSTPANVNLISLRRLN